MLSRAERAKWNAETRENSNILIENEGLDLNKILITGAGSYIGTSFKSWIESRENKSEYEVTELDMTNPDWKKFDFSAFDTVFHVAGIAHIKETEENRDLYYKVNRALAIETARYAKKSGVKQFILLSTMSVFGRTTGKITNDTIVKPVTNYGKSKLLADELIEKMNCDDFNVCILRPPMVYGNGCKGNYRTLSKFARTIPVFPTYSNERSMVYIDYLCEFVRKLIDLNADSNIKEQLYYYPQNEKYVCTSEMISKIAEINNKKMFKVKIFNPIINKFVGKINLFGKVFGSLTYDFEMSRMDFDYHTCTFEESLENTEMRKRR